MRSMTQCIRRRCDPKHNRRRESRRRTVGFEGTRTVAATRDDTSESVRRHCCVIVSSSSVDCYRNSHVHACRNIAKIDDAIKTIEICAAVRTHAHTNDTICCALLSRLAVYLLLSLLCTLLCPYSFALCEQRYSSLAELTRRHISAMEEALSFIPGKMSFSCCRSCLVCSFSRLLGFPVHVQGCLTVVRRSVCKPTGWSADSKDTPKGRDPDAVLTEFDQWSV